MVSLFAVMKPRGMRTFGSFLSAAMVMNLAACAAVSGSPNPPFDQSKYTVTSSPLNSSATDLEALINATGELMRKRLRGQLLSGIDARYLGFGGDVVADKSRFEFGNNILILSSSLASGLTTSSGVEANYAALVALLSGGGAQADSNFLFNQTSLALVSTMDSQRAIVLAEIRAAMGAMPRVPGA